MDLLALKIPKIFVIYSIPFDIFKTLLNSIKTERIIDGYYQCKA